MQEINERQNEGFKIRAELAHPRRQPQFENPPTDDTETRTGDGEFEEVEEEEEEFVAPPLTINISAPHDGFTEKVSQFERQKGIVSRKNINHLKICEHLSQQSDWKFDSEKVRNFDFWDSNPIFTEFLLYRKVSSSTRNWQIFSIIDARTATMLQF